jgi:hypothetical protein
MTHMPSAGTVRAFAAALGIAILAAGLAANPSNQVETRTEGEFRIIQSNGIPDHATGMFPNRGNPNTITEQNHNFRVAMAPVKSGQATPLGMHPFGVAVNGIPFDPGAAEYWNDDPGSGWRHEALSPSLDLGLDRNYAHVQPSGAYHYHGRPTGLLDRLGAPAKMALAGWAADGFPIYATGDRSSYRLKSGTRPGGTAGPGGNHDGTYVQDYEYVAGLGNLDECNGKTGPTPDYPGGTYYYVLSENWPVVPRCFQSAPDSSFFRKGPPGGRPGKKGPGKKKGPPPEPGVRQPF